MSLINIGAGLAAAGQSIADTAGTMSINLQKADLEKQAAVLASQLKGEQYDVASKKAALIPQMLSVDRYLKMTGHAGGLADFGMAVPGDTAGPGPTGSQGDAPAPQKAASANNSPAPADGGGDQPSANEASDKQAFPKGAPVVTPVGDKGKILGLALPPGWTMDQAMVAGPQALSAAWAEWSKPQNVRANAAITFFDFQTGKQKTLYQQPDSPKGTLFDPDTKSFVKIGNADAAIQGAAYDESKGKSQGSLPADLTKIGATADQARRTAEFQKGLDVGTNLVDAYDPATQTTTRITQADALKRTAGGQNVIAPPGADSAGGQRQPSAGLQGDGSYKTQTGTVIPPPPKSPVAGKGLQAAPSAADKATQESYAPVIKNWQDSIEPSVMAEQRFQAIAEAMKATQTGAWESTKQDLAHHLMSYGVISPETAKTLLGSDVGQAQIILKNNFGTALNTLGAARLGRITQNEIFAMQKNLPAMGNQPEANLAMIAQGIGTARYQESLARDWNTARQMGYADPLTYEANWTKANPLQGFVDQAKQEVGGLKGMPDSGQGGGPQTGPKVGDVQQGYTFTGGDPSNKLNWRKK